VVEDCVNAVGVDANTASAPLLARVSGIGAGLAQNIVLHRDTNGHFRSRRSLKNVPRLGPKAFEQCAGFLRIPGGEDPLDASGVRPEAYPVVRRIIEAAKTDIKGLIGRVRRDGRRRSSIAMPRAQPQPDILATLSSALSQSSRSRKLAFRATSSRR
jgi:uncharacterized protein